MRRTVVLMIAIAAGACGAWAPAAAAAPSTCAGADRVPTASTIPAARTAITCLLRAARAGGHAAALRPDRRLRVAAQRFALTLDPAQPLTHKGPDGTSPLQRITAAGYGSGTFSAVEMLGRGNGSLATPAARVTAWLADAGTRRLLLGATYRDVGVGIVTRDGTTTYVVELARHDARHASRH